MSDFGNDGEDIRPIDTAAGARGKKEDDDKLVVRTEDADRNLVKKGDYVDLLRRTPSLRELYAGTGWQLGNYEGDKIDVDLCCFLLDRNGQTRVDEDFIFYNQPSTLEGAVKHLGDSRTGAGDGDDEAILIDTHLLSFDIMKVLIVISIYKGYEKRQGLGMVRDAYIRIVNPDTKHEICRFSLEKTLQDQNETAVIVGALDREGPKWHFRPQIEFVPGGLGGTARRYGMIINQE